MNQEPEIVFMDHLIELVGSYAIAIPQGNKIYVDPLIREYPELLDLVIKHEKDHCRRLEQGFLSRLIGDVVSDYSITLKLEKDYSNLINLDISYRISLRDLVDNLLYGLLLLPLGLFLNLRHLYRIVIHRSDRDKWFIEGN